MKRNLRGLLAGKSLTALLRSRRSAGSGGVVEVLRTFGPFVLPYWPAIVVAALLVAAGTGAGLLRPWPLKFLFDDVLIPGRQLSSAELLLLAIAGAIAAIAILDGIMGFLRQYMLKAAGQKVAFRLRGALYGQIQRLSLTFHDRQRTGDLITRVTKDVDKVQELMTDNIVEASSNLLTLAGMLAIMFWLDWQLSLAMMALTPILFLAIARYRRQIKQAEQHVRRKEGDISSLAQETISSIRLVKAFGREAFELNRFEEHTGEALDANLRVSRTEAAFGSFMDILTAIAMAGLVWLGARRVISGSLTPGELIIFISYLRDFYGPTRALSKLSGQVSRAGVRAEKIAEVLREEPAVKDLPRAKPAPALRGHIRFEHVNFAYLKDTPVLHDIDFEVRPGRAVALVGPTGAGKSTIAALLPRLYDPSAGRILIDGEDIRNYRLASLQSQISFVLQSSILFRATVRENIAYGRPDASFEEIAAAAEVANAHSFIAALPEGYDTVIGERGDTVSGGQRQRIAIARAVVRDAPILILDEPTTGLDAKSEQFVLEALDRLMEGRTTVIIAHKLSTVRRADAIFFVDEGRIVERGSHEELLAQGGRYAELCRLQGLASRRSARAAPALLPLQRASSSRLAAGPRAGRHREEPPPPEGGDGSSPRAHRARPSRAGSARSKAPQLTPASPHRVAVSRTGVQQTKRGGDKVSQYRPQGVTLAERDTLPSDAIEGIKAAYGLGDWLACERTPKGSSNVSFFVATSSGRYVLRRSNARKRLAALRFEVRLVNYLRGEGYPAPQIVQTGQGEDYLESDGAFYLMSAFIEGSPYSQENPHHLLEAARGLALYHRLARQFPGPYYSRPAPVLKGLGPSGLSVLGEVSPTVGTLLNARERRRFEGDCDYLRSQFIRVHRGLAEVLPKMSRLVIQGSYGRSALIFGGDRLVGVVDYDRATLEILGMDFAYTLKAFCRIHDQESDEFRIGLDYERCREFLAAYREVQPLAKTEILALPLIFRAQRLAKVLNKSNNFLIKNAVHAQEAKDARKLATMTEREAVRLSWLEQRGRDLLTALMD